VARYGRLVYSTPRRLGLDQDSCDEVFQLVFAGLLQQLESLRDRDSLPKWLITVSYRTSLRLLAGRRRIESLEEAGPHDLGAPPFEDLERLERQQQLHEAMRRLGGRCEELLRALYTGPSEPNYEQVAKRLQMPLGSVGPTRGRCIQKLVTILHGMNADVTG
jgi:RNA polymerase sigma factor (sigma-70 family)